MPYADVHVGAPECAFCHVHSSRRVAMTAPANQSGTFDGTFSREFADGDILTPPESTVAASDVHSQGQLLTEGIILMSSSLIQPIGSAGQLGRESTGPSKLKSAWASMTGGRQHNEDRCFRCDRGPFYLVVDGMGGHRGGALASQIAVETVPLIFNRELLQTRLTHAGVHAAFTVAVNDAAREMSSVADRHPGYSRMGCTLAMATVIAGRLCFSNIGDCRVYLLRGNTLQRLTKDQTLVQEMVDAGVISEDAADTHRWRHVVTNSVSAKGVHHGVTTSYLDLVRGDRVLLTSDGLTGAMSDDEIAEKMSNAVGPEDCVCRLMDKASRREASDNVTCIVFETDAT